MNKEIKYIGFYDIPDPFYKRVSALSAINKMNYICDALNRADFKVHIISPSWIEDSCNSAKYQKRSTFSLSSNLRLTQVASFGTSNKWTRNVKILFSLIWLFFWLVFNTKKNEKVLVYHSPWLAFPLLVAKKIIGFKIVLEVEEIYHKVWKIKSILKKLEQKIILESDYYIVVSDVLSSMLPDKDNIILYGSYDIPKKENFNIEVKKTDVIDVVYAGSIDTTKGGAFNIVNCLEFLPQNYCLHILGYGSEELIYDLCQYIDIQNMKHKRRGCIYHGVRLGLDFSNFLHECHIAVNPQIEGQYMATAFPSKILTYLCHNLPVVSTKISSVIKSSLSNHIFFSENDSPEEISKAILSIDLNIKTDNHDLIKKLDYDFINGLKSKFKDE